jgi:hypothetical protein
MTRDRLKDEILNRVIDIVGENYIPTLNSDSFNFSSAISAAYQSVDTVNKLKDSIGTLIDQYHDEIAVMVQIAIESEAETIAARVRDAIKEVPCNLSY